jgi:hypothetical protein
MDENTRGRLASATILIGIGAWFLAVELAPGLRDWAYGAETWPLAIVGGGGLLLLVGLVTWTPGLAIPACIVGGIGGLLYYQNRTGDWESWAYAWTLVPAFVAVGLVVVGLMRGRPRGPVIAAGWLLFVSAVLFGVFGSFLGAPIELSRWWPAALILLGALLLAQSVVRRRPA